ncbi:beta strand repeat-containing protein [Costertonia aggregata]|uniref:Uncharacterized protein n=1 Tax=Costertonia aggregata TaxID=343403 RepID=A0A7H9ALI5_9FLAO|nr:hypothetical protein [Costertonia aggregata]QLG44322.1 hypothetical protein HYG79_02835 [Costertonia aggregata]
MKLKSILFTACLFMSLTALGQIKIGDNPQNIDAASVLELESQSRALVITRVNTAQMNSITPLAGALVYNTDLQCVHYYDGAQWVNFCDSQTFTTEAIVNTNETIVITPDLDNASSNFEIAKRGIQSDNITIGGVNTGNIQDGTILGDDIQAGAITTTNIANNAITTDKIADQTIQTIDILPANNNDVLTTEGSTVVWKRLSALNIDGENITTNDGSIAITSGANGSVLLPVDIEVAPLGITTAKLSDDAVNNSKLADGAVRRENMTPDAISSAEIEDRTIVPNDLADGTTAGEVIQWDGTDWRLVEVSSLSVTEVDGVIGNEVTGPTDTTLQVNGLGTSTDPLTLDVSPEGINTVELATDAVTTIKILDANITDAKLDKANIPLSGFGAAGAALDLGSNQINNLLDPTLNQDAATKIYVDNAVGGINTLADGRIYIGDGTDTAQEIILGGDATLANDGTLTIANNAITTIKILDANITNAKLDKANIPLSGFAAAAAALDLGNNQVNNLANPTLNQDAATKLYVDTAIGGVNTLADGRIYIGDATNNVQEVAITGDATLSNTGVLTIANDAITTTKILNDAVTIDKINGDGALNSLLVTDGAGDPFWIERDLLVDGTTVGFNATPQLEVLENGITNLQMADNAINTDEIVDDAVNAIKIAPDVAGTGLQQNATTGALEINPATITGDGDITSTELTITGGIDAAFNNVTLEIAADAVTTVKILDNNVTPAKIAQGASGNVLTTDASGDVVWAAPSEATVTATAGSVFFANGSNGVAENNAQLFWDATNNRLGVGAATRPLANKLTVDGTTRTSGLLNSNGTEGTPSYRFSNDTGLDTGMYFPAQDQLAFSAGGQEILRLRESVGNGLEAIIEGTLELNDQLVDINGNTGNVGDVLKATATGTEWAEPAVVVMGKANGANAIKVSGATVAGGGGINTVSFNTARGDNNYIIQVSVVGDNRIYVTAQTTGSFTVEIRRNSDNALVVAEWFFTITDF